MYKVGEYIPEEKVVEIFNENSTKICAEQEEHIHGENVLVDFCITEGGYSVDYVKELIDEGYRFFVD